MSLFRYVLRPQIHFSQVLDALAIPIVLGAVLVRIGNFMNGEIVGRVTDVPWAMIFPRYDMHPRHPIQLYEAAYALFLLAALICIDRWQRYINTDGKNQYAGLQFTVFGVGYAVFRFVAEHLKECQTLEPAFPLTMGQFLTLPFFFLACALLYWVLRSNNAAHQQSETDQKTR